MEKINLCQNCGKRAATQNWVGQGGILDFVHGNYQRWCDKCCIKAQLKSIKKSAKRIPALERKLKKL